MANPNLLEATRDNKPGKETGKVDGGKGAKRRDAERGARWTQRPPLSCPLCSLDLYSRLQYTVRALPSGRPVCICLPLASCPKPRVRAPSESARDPSLHTGAQQMLGEGIRRQPPGHPGRHLPAGRRRSALVVARSGRSRAPRPEDAAPAQPRLALVFREPGPSPGEEIPRVRSCFLVSAQTSRPPGTLQTSQYRPSPLTRPTCPLLVGVKSLRQLPELTGTVASPEGSPPLSLSSLIPGEEPRRLEPARPSSNLGHPLPQARRGRGHPGFFKFLLGGAQPGPEAGAGPLRGENPNP